MPREPFSRADTTRELQAAWFRYRLYGASGQIAKRNKEKNNILRLSKKLGYQKPRIS